MEAWLLEVAEKGGHWIYVALFVSAFLENLIPPIPGDTVTLIGAYLVGRGGLNFWLVWWSTTLGSVAGFMSLFLLAYWLEEKFLEQRLLRWVKPAQLEKSRRWFDRYGYGVVLANRFLSGVRSVISLAAGFHRLNPLKVFVMATISASLWNGMLIYIGAFLGKSWEQIAQYLKLYNKFILLSLALLVVLVLIYKLGRAAWYSAKEKGSME